jgi:hypothetical protein
MARRTGFAERNVIARKDFTQQISKKAAIGGLRAKNYSIDAFPEVLRVTFLRAATATASSKRVTRQQLEFFGIQSLRVLSDT